MWPTWIASCQMSKLPSQPCTYYNRLPFESEDFPSATEQKWMTWTVSVVSYMKELVEQTYPWLSCWWSGRSYLCLAIIGATFPGGSFWFQLDSNCTAMIGSTDELFYCSAFNGKVERSNYTGFETGINLHHRCPSEDAETLNRPRFISIRKVLFA